MSGDISTVVVGHRRNKPKSLSGIETKRQQILKLLEENAEINLNPYQGLKLSLSDSSALARSPK